MESEQKDQFIDFNFIKECKTRNSPHIEVEVKEEIKAKRMDNIYCLGLISAYYIRLAARVIREKSKILKKDFTKKRSSKISKFIMMK